MSGSLYGAPPAASGLYAGAMPPITPGGVPPWLMAQMIAANQAPQAAPTAPPPPPAQPPPQPAAMPPQDAAVGSLGGVPAPAPGSWGNLLHGLGHSAASLFTGPGWGGAPPPAAGAPQAAPQGGGLPQPPPQLPPPGAGPADPLWSRIVAGESSGNPNAHNATPGSTSSGLGGITNPTFGDFLASPQNGGQWTAADKNNPQAQKAAFDWRQGQIGSLYQTALNRPPTDPERIAGWVLGPTGATALSSAPNAPIGQSLAGVYGKGLPGMFAANPFLNPAMTGQQALAALGSRYAGGGAATPPGGPLQTPTTPPGVYLAASQQDQPSRADGSSSDAAALGIPAYQVPHATTADKLLALGSGLLGAPTLGIGLGRGAGAVEALRQQDMARGIQGQQLNNQLARINMMDNFYGMRYNPNIQGALSSAKTAASLGAKETGEDIGSLQEAGQNATVANARLDAISHLLPQAGTGPGYQATIRAIANYFNVPVGTTTPTGAQLSAAIMSQTRLGGYTMKGMRTQKEFQSVNEGLLAADKNPQALAGVVAGMRRINDLQQGIYSSWNSLSDNQQSQMRNNPAMFQRWLGGQFSTWGQKTAQTGLYTTPGQPGGAPAPAAAAPPAGGGFTVTYHN